MESPESRQDVIDLDAVEPQTILSVRLFGKDWPVRSHLDMPMTDVESILGIHERIRSRPWHEQLREGRKLVALLIPSMTTEEIGKMTGRQVTRIIAEIVGVPTVGPTDAGPKKE